MKATQARPLDFLKAAPQLSIPIYQRSYNWTERECRQPSLLLSRLEAWWDRHIITKGGCWCS